MTHADLHNAIALQAINELRSGGLDVAANRLVDAEGYARSGYAVLLERTDLNAYELAPEMARVAVVAYVRSRLKSNEPETDPQYLAARKHWARRARVLFERGAISRDRTENPDPFDGGADRSERGRNLV